jgi:hypothetical protein
VRRWLFVSRNVALGGFFFRIRIMQRDVDRPVFCSSNANAHPI